MPRQRLFAVAYACSGAAALVYEVAWMRLLTLQMGHTVAAASIVRAAFMGGLACGAWVAGGPAASIARARPLRAYAALELFIAVVALALPYLLVATNDRDRLTSLAGALATRFSAQPDAHYYRAVALMMRGRTDEAIGEARGVVEADPRHARAQQLLGTACMTLGRDECARAAYEAALQADPRDIVPCIRLGELHLRSANAAAAFGYFAEALFLNRDSEPARRGLEEARATLRGAAP